MKQKKYNCANCEFAAKSSGGLKSHMRKHTEAPKRHQRFDLNIVTQEQADELVAHMANMVCTSGWMLFKQIIDGNIAVLENAIIERKDPVSGEKLTDAELDEARQRRAIMKELIGKPEQLMEKFKRQPTMKTETYDPYAVDVRQFNPNSRVGDPMSHVLQ
jgi:hypothetical protein